MNVINQAVTDKFALYNADCVDVVRSLPDNSIDFSVYSPPFESLYVFSNSERDMGNNASSSDFWQHYRYLIAEMYRAMKPGEKQEFQVKVNIPEDAYLGNYAALIAFTEKVPEGDVAGYYPNFPGTMQLNIQVRVRPSVQILTPYVNDLVEAGKTYTYEIKLRNTGDKDIAISPELTREGGIIYAEDVVSSTGMPKQTFGDDAISVEAPEKIKAGQTAVIELTLFLSLSSHATRGSLPPHQCYV